MYIPTEKDVKWVVEQPLRAWSQGLVDKYNIQEGDILKTQFTTPDNRAYLYRDEEGDLGEEIWIDDGDILDENVSQY